MHVLCTCYARVMRVLCTFYACVMHMSHGVFQINLWSVHMDPQLFPEPNTFQPERFLDQDGNFVKHEAVIPFGIGESVWEPCICYTEQIMGIVVATFALLSTCL